MRACRRRIGCRSRRRQRLSRLFGRTHTGPAWTRLRDGRGGPRRDRSWAGRRVRMARRYAPHHADTAGGSRTSVTVFEHTWREGRREGPFCDGYQLVKELDAPSVRLMGWCAPVITVLQRSWETCGFLGDLRGDFGGFFLGVVAQNDQRRAARFGKVVAIHGQRGEFLRDLVPNTARDCADDS